MKMKLALSYKIILIVTLLLFTLSRRKDNKKIIAQSITDLVEKYNIEESKHSGKSYSEIETLQDKIYKLIQDGDEVDKKAALKACEDS